MTLFSSVSQKLKDGYTLYNDYMKYNLKSSGTYYY